mmetsp:Transcript_13021/g.15804  ORF Transcript_13021/g.15804 Transcript_13021/m.15804 type:complete len:339 (+) Transcript_13021:154-1170(+)
MTMDFDSLLSEHVESANSSKRRKRDREYSGNQRRQTSARRSESWKREKKQKYSSEKEFIEYRLKRRLSFTRVKSGCNRYLVVIPAGDNSLHCHPGSRWFPCNSSKSEEGINEKKINEKSKFDLCIIYYGVDDCLAKEYEKQCKYFFHKQGPKWQLIRHVLKEGFWKDYEYIWMPDDDLEINRKSIERMFEIASKYGVKMGQPSLYNKNIQKQYIPLLVHRRNTILHFTNFVEIMCPFFRFDIMDEIVKTIDDENVKSGWGLDILWPNLINFQDIAVIDETPLTHTRPQNAFNLQSSFYTKYKIDPQRECFDLLRKYKVRDFRKRSFEEIRKTKLQNIE